MSPFDTPYPLTELDAASADGSGERGQYDYIIVGGELFSYSYSKPPKGSSEPGANFLQVERADAY